MTMLQKMAKMSVRIHTCGLCMHADFIRSPEIISERKVRPLESVHSFHGDFSTSNRKHTRRVFSLLLFQLVFSIEHRSHLGGRESLEAIGIDRFGASAPAEKIYKEFGITKEAVIAAAKSLI
ncbi:uncharacterized protein [Arachis hypogaea]|uniref:uncharacterized protein isoform X2 n=1 Tax=Arachis hypogaea TaxID=3818 RepID=UPI003B20BA63